MKKILNLLFKLSFCIIVLFSFFFFIAERDAYRPAPLSFKGSIAEPFREKGVHISAKIYDKHESKAYLDRDLLQVGYQPIQITIQNNTELTYALSSRSVDFHVADGGKVARRVSYQAIPRAIGFKVAGFIFWPFLIPGAIDSIVTFKSHMHMKRDYQVKSIKDKEEIVLPYSTVNRILFLPKEQTPSDFTLHLKQVKNKRLYSFLVKLNP